jgi:hypothetical protein
MTMFNLKNLGLSASLACAALAHECDLSAAEIPRSNEASLAQEVETPVATNSYFDPSGALKGYKISEDLIEVPQNRIGFALPYLAAVIGAGAGIWLVSNSKSSSYGVNYNTFSKTHLVGAAIGGVMFFGVSFAFTPTASVEFYTSNIDVLSTSEPRYEGKYRRGPYYDQKIMIKELKFPLLHTAKTPLTSGQALDVTFYLDSKNNITSWFAVPAE